MMSLQTCLENYWVNVVEANANAHEKKKSLVTEFISKLVQFASSRDPRFSRKPIYVGSEWQGTEVEGYSDFDILLPLTIYAVCEQWETGQSRVFLYETGDGFRQWNSTGSGVISSREVRQRLIDLTMTMITEQWNVWNVCNTVQASVSTAPSIPVKIMLHCEEPIHIDFTPCIYIQNVRGSGRNALVNGQIIRSFQSVNWPSEKHIKELKECIAFFPAREQWRVSLPEGHKVLIRDFDLERTCHKKLYRILKTLSYREFQEDSVKFPSYIIAVAMFREINQYPFRRDWANDQLATRFQSLLNRLSAAFSNGIFKDYFLPGSNLLEPIERHNGMEPLERYARNIKALRKDPCASLRGQCCVPNPCEQPNEHLRNGNSFVITLDSESEEEDRLIYHYPSNSCNYCTIL